MDIECPYCEQEFDICHDDGFGYDEGVKHQYECPHCGKNFVFKTSVIWYYEAEKAECLNEGMHDYKITATWPKEFSTMRCSMCGDERKLTAAERKTHNIGTPESYYENLKNVSFHKLE